MKPIVLNVRFAVKERILKGLRRCRGAGDKARYLVIVNLLNGRSVAEVVEILRMHNTTAYRVSKRFQAYGEAGLHDGRAVIGADKLDEDYSSKLDRVVRGTPPQYGWRRPTWTRELLVETMVRLTGRRIHVATMSRALAQIKARRGRPRPRVGCPWHPAAKTRRWNRLALLRATLPRGEAAFYADEVDIHLNPKVGLDWMGRGQQKDVDTPGQNQKRYVAGAWDVGSHRLIWVEGERKTSYLFLDLLDRLRKTYPAATCLHLVLDNYRIHQSEIVEAALRGYLAGTIKLPFLPPYGPDPNRIERVWQDLHAHVTRNHRCADMRALMQEVRYYLNKRNRKAQQRRIAA